MTGRYVPGDRNGRDRGYIALFERRCRPGQPDSAVTALASSATVDGCSLRSRTEERLRVRVADPAPAVGSDPLRVDDRPVGLLLGCPRLFSYVPRKPRTTASGRSPRRGHRVWTHRTPPPPPPRIVGGPCRADGRSWRSPSSNAHDRADVINADGPRAGVTASLELRGAPAWRLTAFDAVAAPLGGTPHLFARTDGAAFHWFTLRFDLGVLARTRFLVLLRPDVGTTFAVRL